MTPETLKIACEEAQRFLIKASMVKVQKVQGAHPYEFCHPKEANAATKRASMDLTKALAKLRKS